MRYTVGQSTPDATVTRARILLAVRRFSLVFGAILLTHAGVALGDTPDSAKWQREACSATGVLTMKYPKGGGRTRGACVATAIDPKGDFVVPRHCIQGALSAAYTPLRSTGASKSKTHPVLGIYRIDSTRNGKEATDALNADAVRIRVDIPANETSTVNVAAEVPDEHQSGQLHMLVNLATKRGKAGECSVRKVALTSLFDTPEFVGRTIRIGSETPTGGSGTPVFVSGGFLGFVVGGSSENGQYNDVVTVLVDHPVVHGGGELLSFAEWNETHKADAWSFFYRAVDFCEKDTALLGRALDLDPSISEGWFRRAACAANSGEGSRAVEYFEKALESRPMPETYYRLGQVCLFADLDVEKGRIALQTALKLDPDYYSARLTLAGSYVEKGEMKNAALHYGYIFDRWPNVQEQILQLVEQEYPEFAAELRASRGEQE